MSFWMQEILENLYRLLSLLAKVPFARRLIISNKYEYDYTVLAPLAMTSVPPSIIPYLPKLPKEDELPDQKWVTLVICVISLLNQKEKSSNLINESVANEHEINSLESIYEQIKAAQETADITNAVLQLKSVLKLEEFDDMGVVSLKTNDDIQMESNLSHVEDRFDKIDQEIKFWLSQIPQEKPANFLQADELTKLDEIEKFDKELSGHLLEITRFLGRNLIDNQQDLREQLETTTPNLTLKDYENLINPLTIKPETVKSFQRDQVFAYMQVAGPNPVMLQQIKKIDSKLPITNEQYQNVVSQDSLVAALQEGRLYLADYSLLDDLVNGNFGAKPKYMYAPVALFAVPPDKYQDKNLLPIAIRCQQTPEDENTIFTPLDGDNWMTAKTVLQMADSNYHELISHLAQTHLFIEPFVLATNRCFQDNHAVRFLLKPHLQGTILINYGAHKLLLAPEGPIDALLGGTIGSNCQLAIKKAKSHLANFNDVAFSKTLEKRGVNNSQQLPIYPYRDDGQRIWDAIHQWVYPCCVTLGRGKIEFRVSQEG
ncbi:MAG TPA: hypothetical protein IGS40_09610 [Trichormus sp. M33_DOE_039]|nr:hypothetical protein [Trichormus sp. M33_DOE_039]